MIHRHLLWLADRRWPVLIAVLVVLSVALRALGFPSPVLFGALLAGMTLALSRWGPPSMPGGLGTIGQGLIGVVIGALAQPATLRVVAGHSVAVVAVCLATLVLSLGLGQGLRLHGVSAVTAAFASVAGGASGIVAMARDLGADDRVVGVVQYLRVLIIMLGMPLVTTLVFRPDHGRGVLGTPESSGWLSGSAFVLVSLGAGMLLSRLLPFPAGGVLVPMVVAAVLSLSGALGSVAVPRPVENLGYALVGMQVGLRFSRESLRTIARLLPTAIGLIVLLIAGTAGLGLLLANVTGVSPLDGYLATTPGGLYAVLAIAVDTGADVTFVLAVQVIRLLVMLLLAPLVARAFRRR